MALDTVIFIIIIIIIQCCYNNGLIHHMLYGTALLSCLSNGNAVCIFTTVNNVGYLYLKSHLHKMRRVFISHAYCCLQTINRAFVY